MSALSRVNNLTTTHSPRELALEAIVLRQQQELVKLNRAITRRNRSIAILKGHLQHHRAEVNFAASALNAIAAELVPDPKVRMAKVEA